MYRPKFKIKDEVWWTVSDRIVGGTVEGIACHKGDKPWYYCRLSSGIVTMHRARELYASFDDAYSAWKEKKYSRDNPPHAWQSAQVTGIIRDTQEEKSRDAIIVGTQTSGTTGRTR